MEPSVGAVIIAFHPDESHLERLVARLGAQVTFICIVNNGQPLQSSHYAQTDYLKCIQNAENLGVAAALNTGIDLVREQGCEYVVTFDQDSMPDDVFVSQLVKESTALDRQGVKWCALGPQVYDARTGQPAPLPRLEKGKVVLDRSPQPGTVAVLHTISSGTLMRVKTFLDVGPFDTGLFIDYVDIEWCLRASGNHLQSFVTRSARLEHRLGGEIRRFMGKDIPMHHASRHYYLMRNGVALLRRNYIPVAWKRFDRKLLMVRFISYSLLSPRPFHHVAMMLRGVRDGLRGRSGRLDAAHV